MYLCSAEALGVCPGQQGVKHRGRERASRYQMELCFEKNREKVLRYIPKQTSGTYLEDSEETKYILSF